MHTPFPHYQNSYIELIGGNKIYHYTKLESFFKILDSMSLKTSKLNTLNDLNEANISSTQNLDPMLKINTEQFIIDHCSTISFSQDFQYNGFFQQGTNRPRMWAQYAENNNGACIVLNKDRFLEINRGVLQDKFYKLEPVNYLFYVAKNEFSSANTEQEFANENYQTIFFKKHLDWEHENEIRLFGIDLPPYLSIDGAIDHICLGNKFIGKENYNLDKLIDYISDPMKKCYKKFIPHSFSSVFRSLSGYIELDIADFFEMRNIDRNSKNIDDYYNWLNKEFNYRYIE